MPRLASSFKTEGAVRQDDRGTAEYITDQECVESTKDFDVEVENTVSPILTSSTSSFEEPTASRIDEQVSSLEVLVKTVKIGSAENHRTLLHVDSVSFSSRRKIALKVARRAHAASASAEGLETRELSIRKRLSRPMKRLILIPQRSLRTLQSRVTVSAPRTLLQRGLPSSAKMSAFFDSKELKSSTPAEFQARWNFDFKTDMPKLGPWEWTPVCAG